MGHPPNFPDDPNHDTTICILELSVFLMATLVDTTVTTNESYRFVDSRTPPVRAIRPILGLPTEMNTSGA